jgi:hypothetical protein
MKKKTGFQLYPKTDKEVKTKYSIWQYKPYKLGKKEKDKKNLYRETMNLSLSLSHTQAQRVKLGYWV